MTKKVNITKTEYENKRRDRARLLRLKKLHNEQGKILNQIKPKVEKKV